MCLCFDSFACEPDFRCFYNVLFLIFWYYVGFFVSLVQRLVYDCWTANTVLMLWARSRSCSGRLCLRTHPLLFFSNGHLCSLAAHSLGGDWPAKLRRILDECQWQRVGEIYWVDMASCISFWCAFIGSSSPGNRSSTHQPIYCTVYSSYCWSIYWSDLFLFSSCFG